MTSDRKILVLCCIAAASALCFVVWVVVRTFEGNPGIYLTDNFLVVDTFAANAQISYKRIEISKVQILDFRDAPSLRPKTRISGSSAMNEGLYYLRNGDRAYVSIYGRAPLLYIPAGKNISVLVRMEDPSILLCGLLDKSKTDRSLLHSTLREWTSRCEGHPVKL